MKPKQILGVTERKDADGKKQSFWSRIGVAFENKDGSLNLKFDYFPTDPNTTIQVREPSERDTP
jgi:hypothetical protein